LHFGIKPVTQDGSDDHEAHQLLNSGSPPGGVSLPPAYIDTVESVEMDIATIRREIEVLKGLHANHLRADFARTSESGAKEEAAIQHKTTQIKGIFLGAEKLIRSIGDIPSPGDSKDSGKMTQGDLIKLNTQRALAMELTDLSNTFKATQTQYMARLETREDRVDRFDAAWMPDDGDDNTWLDPGMTNTQLGVLSQRNIEVQRRGREIAKIAETVNEIATIFKELAVLIIDQGTMLDRIDYNIEQTLASTEEAKKEISQASEYQKSFRSKLCIILLIVMVMVVAVLLIVKKTPAPTKSS
jgi:syntaxin 16